MPRPKKNKQAGAAFKELLEQKGFSNYKLAKAIGMGTAHIGRITSGEIASPTPATLEKIAAALGVELGELTMIFAQSPVRSHSAEVPPPQESAQEETPSKNTDFVGREEAIAHLNTVITSRKAKVIGIYGKGGVGKTKLAEQYFEQFFEAKGFKILRLDVGMETKSITCIKSWIEDRLRLDFKDELERDFDIIRLLDRLRRHLQAQRVGILIDNLEPALDKDGKFIDHGYVQLLRVLTEPKVQSITLITSRESPNESKVTIDPYSLPELDEDAWREFFSKFEINTNTPALSAMHRAYGGNALAMKVLCYPIQATYESDLEAYWEDHKEYLLKGEIRDLVASQFNRLQELDIKVYKLLCRLGVYRYQNISKVPLTGLLCLLEDVLEEERRQVVESLQRSNLIEFRKGKQGVVIEAEEYLAEEYLWEKHPLFAKFPRDQGWMMGFEYIQGQSKLVVFQPSGYWLHPMILAEATARLKSSGESLDNLLSSMKRQIDALVLCDNKLQLFLKWVYKKQKTLFLNIPYKPALIRAFYLALALDIEWTLGVEIDNKILEDSSAHHSMDIILAIEADITFDIANVLGGILFFIQVFNPTSIFSQLAKTSDLDYIDFALEIVTRINHALDPEVKLNSELRQGLQEVKYRLPKEIDKISFARTFAPLYAEYAKIDIAELYAEMYQPTIKRKIPIVLLSKLKQIGTNDLRKIIEIFEDWFQKNGQIWLQKVYDVISNIPRQNISEDWQLNEQQKQRLRQYYDANWLLVDCLKKASDVSPEVRSHIEDTLLLPIAEIESERLT